MKKTILFIITTLFSCYCFCQNSPKIEFKKTDNILDYGLVSKKSDTGVRSIEFKNVGDAPLIITNVLATPGFTILFFPKEPINPNKTAKMEIKYSMIAGPIRKTITIESNAVNYQQGRIPLKIKGEVLD
jgi:hypothetical protein